MENNMDLNEVVNTELMESVADTTICGDSDLQRAGIFGLGMAAGAVLWETVAKPGYRKLRAIIKLKAKQRADKKKAMENPVEAKVADSEENQPEE